MSDETHRSSSPSSGEGSRRQGSGSDHNRARVKRKKKKKKSSKGVSPELSSRLVTIVLILLGALFIFSLYYIVVNLNVKTTK